MFQAPEQFMALNKANLEATVRFAGIALEGAERMLEVQLKAAKSAFADGVQRRSRKSTSWWKSKSPSSTSRL